VLKVHKFQICLFTPPPSRRLSAVAVEISTSKGKRTSEDRSFDLRHLGGQQLSEEDISALKEIAISRAISPHPCSLAAATKRF
jgi:hypothetical protein